MTKVKITVFTPTYNRYNNILNLYHSLQKQTFCNFEWLVIDDGSSDGTENLFEKLLHELNPFQIRYYKFQNCGKQREINRALDVAKGELFFTVDSDDCLTPNALYWINEWDTMIPKCGKYCGFAGNDGDLQGNPINPYSGKSYIDATFFDRDPHSEKFIGYDRPWVLYTDIHRKYKYPEFEGEKFITEAVVWNRMAADGYMIRCFDEVIYLIEHQKNGLTDKIHEILVNNPWGYGLWIKEMVEQKNYSWLKKIKSYYSFYSEMCMYASTGKIAKYVSAGKLEMMLISIVYKLKHG